MKCRSSILFFALILALCSAAPARSWLAEDLHTRVVRVTPLTETFEVSSYYGGDAHGPTQKIFLLFDQRVAVLIVTKDGTSDASGEIHVFPSSASPEALRKWRNNQHSDALYSDAAEASRTIILSPQHFHSTVSAPLRHEVGGEGDEYDVVRVSFRIDGFTDGEVTVEPFSGSLDAFVSTMGPSRK